MRLASLRTIPLGLVILLVASLAALAVPAAAETDPSPDEVVQPDDDDQSDDDDEGEETAEPIRLEVPDSSASVGKTVRVTVHVDPRLIDESPVVEAVHHSPGHEKGNGGKKEEGSGTWDITVDFGDGSGPSQAAVRDAGPKVRARAQHSYSYAGIYDIAVVASSDEHGTLTATGQLEVVEASEDVHGTNRFETAVAISQESFAAGTARSVILARGDSFADALAASPLTALEDGPLLLTAPGHIPDVVLDEIARVLDPEGPQTIYVLGGEAAISAAVEEALTGLGYLVERFAGVDRVATALLVTAHLQANGVDLDEVLVARADSFADALAAGAYAARNTVPVLLTDRKSLDPRVRDFLHGLGEPIDVYVLGGPAAIHRHVVMALEADGHAVTRISGEDRYATSAAAAQEWFSDTEHVVVVTGDQFADALAAAGYAARLDAPLLLVSGRVPAAVAAFLEAKTDRTATVVGGVAAVTQGVRAELRAAAAR